MQVPGVTPEPGLGLRLSKLATAMLLAGWCRVKMREFASQEFELLRIGCLAAAGFGSELQH